jgi:predicted PurR-regulated permease PerM
MTERRALLVLTAVLGLLAAWLLRHFLAALAWASVLAIATWPLYSRFAGRFSGRGGLLAPFLFTLLIAILFVLPLAFLAIEVGREALVFVHWASAVQETGLMVPEWVARLPFGAYLTAWWKANLSDPGAAAQLLGHVDKSVLIDWIRSLGVELLGRSTILIFTLLAVFFLYRDGATLGHHLVAMAKRAFGPEGEQLGARLVAVIRGTVDGLVLVGLAEGLLLGVAYGIVGLPHAALLGALTCVLAMIPFGAPIVFILGALFLLAQSEIAAAGALFGFGVAVTFVADHFVRPVLIGGTARLSFLWVLLGILGGVETFGVIGLFLGPAILATLVALWRYWVAASSNPSS